jgi:hypothetical protein
MFKRVEKRRRKKEEEEKLGLNEDMKEVLGMHDTDSEESDSDSDQSVSDDDAASGGEEDEEIEEGDFKEGSIHGGEERAGEDGEPAITVQEALRDPVYLISLQPEVKACIVCPGKLLKGRKMVGLHRQSNACTLSFLPSSEI